MIPRCLLLVALLVSTVAHGQDERRVRLRAAFAAAETGQIDISQASAYAGDPLFPWLQAAVLRRSIERADAGQVHGVLAQLGEQPAADWLRSAWLAELARREDWTSFRRDYRPVDDPALRCADLQARSEAGLSPDWVAQARALWLTAGSLPARCDAPLSRLAEAGQLDDALRWQRIDLVLATGDAGLIRAIGAGMQSPAAAELAQAYASYVAAPAEVLPEWPASERNGRVIASALRRLAKRDPVRARRLLLGPAGARLDANLRAGVAYQIALWTVASYLPGSAERLSEVPASAYDDKLHEWQVREALSRNDTAAALGAITRMPPLQREDAHWRYLEARLRERLGQSSAARVLYAKAALSPSFHGWLAADRLQQPYTLCALEPSADSAMAQRIAGNAALSRALDLFAIDHPELAAREWAAAVATMSDAERRVAVRRALDAGWFDRAVFGMGAAPDDTRHYSLRFPLHHEADIRQQSQLNGLDPAWVAGQTRAESSFMAMARSAADARGLMQLLPGTGSLTARRLGLEWQGGDSLFDPSTNIRLGTAYLRQMLDRFDGLAYLAIAAYNAGPAPVQRWRATRGQLDPDFFIETIPYKETRDYVSRVLSFSVVYDWRLNGKATPLTERMLGRLVRDPSQRRAFTCPAGNPERP